MKAICKNYKGIEYVQLNELPVIQQRSLLQTKGSPLFIKILVDGKILSHCIQYKDYLSWYENVYVIGTVVLEPRVSEVVEINSTLALKQA